MPDFLFLPGQPVFVFESLVPEIDKDYFEIVMSLLECHRPGVPCMKAWLGEPFLAVDGNSQVVASIHRDVEKVVRGMEDVDPIFRDFECAIVA